MPPQAENFDSYAHDYEKLLNQGLAVSGESATFFARERVRWLAKRFDRLKFFPKTLLDYGCGTGNSTPLFLDLLKVRSVIGLDPSIKSLEAARSKHSSLPAEYRLIQEYTPHQQVDLVFCNGVFHHIPPPERPRVLRYIADCLRMDGMLAIWENNPWNPGTRYIMRRIPFDHDAITLTPRYARSLLGLTGFEVVTTDFYFVFPAPLKFLRWLEPSLTQLPLGAQYLILCHKKP